MNLLQILKNGLDNFSMSKNVIILEELISSSPEMTMEFAKSFAKKLTRKKIAFFGDLGAGKTTFIKGLCSYFNIDKDDVTSPTFTYLNIYNGNKQIFHFDLYRLKEKKHFFSLGFDEYLLSDEICLIEWPNILEKDFILDDAISINIEHFNNNRKITISKMGK